MTPIRRKALGDRLRVARRRCELSQDEVAELLGVKRQTVSAWETGVTVPTAFQVADLAAAYCASAHHLLFGAHYEHVDVKAFLPGTGIQEKQTTQRASPPADEQLLVSGLPHEPGAPVPPGAAEVAPRRQPIPWLASMLGRSGTP